MSNVSQEERFLRMLFPATQRCGRHELKQLTMGHFLLMRRVRCPFGQALPLTEISYGGGDLATALLICTRDWREAVEVLHSGPWALRWAMFRHTYHGLKLALMAAEFNAYIMAAMSRPSLLPAAQKSTPGKVGGMATRNLDAPFWLVMYRRLRESGLVNESVLDEPVQRVLWMDASRAEEAGVVKWSDEADEALQQFVLSEIAKAQEQAAKVEAEQCETKSEVPSA